MTIDEWTANLTMGREIEFKFRDEAFLISYIPDSVPTQYYIWHDTQKREVCRGDLNCILDFEFEKFISLRKEAALFFVDYFL